MGRRSVWVQAGFSQFAGLAAWGGLVVCSFVVLAFHSAEPGKAATPPASQGPSDRPSLLVFAHPKCPCTMATIEQLDRMSSHCQGQLNIELYVFQPSAYDRSWAMDRLWKRASRIKDLTLSFDPDGRMAKSYGAETSGQALLYSKEGVLVFSGGITAARGHEGSNAGQDAIEEFVLRERTTINTAPVFGCALANEGGASSP